MPTIRGITINTMTQLNAMTAAQLRAAAEAVGVAKSYAFRANEQGDPNFTGVTQHRSDVVKRRLALKFGLRKSKEKAQAKIAKAVKKKQAIRRGTEARANLTWDKLYKIARARKREASRHCVKAGGIREEGLKRMTRVQLQNYIARTNK